MLDLHGSGEDEIPAALLQAAPAHPASERNEILAAWLQAVPES